MVIQIALGIVVAILILRALPVVLSIVLWLFKDNSKGAKKEFPKIPDKIAWGIILGIVLLFVWVFRDAIIGNYHKSMNTNPVLVEQIAGNDAVPRNIDNPRSKLPTDVIPISQTDQEESEDAKSFINEWNNISAKYDKRTEP
jgi:hypothetical protein